jgi:uncharacterized protein YndB with AHSA1/START domain
MDTAGNTVAAGPDTRPGGHELFITRVLDAPRTLVFRAWSSPEHLVRWWGPRGFTTFSFTMDFRPGGAWRAGMRSPDGLDYWMQGIYREIAPPERLAFTFAWDDAHGQPTDDTLVTVSFIEENGRTRLAFHQAPFAAVEQRDAHVGGWNAAFDCLVEYLGTL